MRLAEMARYGARFAANALDSSSPRLLYIEVTKRCNAFCDFCPYWQTHERGELENYAPIVEKMQPFCVTFTGGEPLLRRDLANLVSQVRAVPKRPYTAVLTNGWLLSIARAQALRDAGLEQLSISIDFVGEAHDRQRGLPGLYRRIVDRLPSLTKLGFDRIVINTVIMESNLDHVLDLAKLTAQWGVYSSFSCYSPLKTDAPGELVKKHNWTELRRVVGALKQLKRKQSNIISSDFYLDRVVPFFEGGGHVGERCEAAGRRFFHVDPWGGVKICPEFQPFAHWTELDSKKPAAHDCTRCWYGCRGENEAPLTLTRIRDLHIAPSLRPALRMS